MSPTANTESIATALLLLQNNNSVETVIACLDNLAISAEVCADGIYAARLIQERKFEAVFIEPEATKAVGPFLDRLRSSPSNRNAVTFAISDRLNRGHALAEKPNFLLEQPVSRDAIDQTLKISFGLIVRERRRYFRCPVIVPATLSNQELKTIQCEVVNVSEGGIALSAPTNLRRGLTVNLQFQLPGQIARLAVSKPDDHNSRFGSGRSGFRRSHGQTGC
jgi:response regulator RpfG family c-di-GMP phosphodiesterase